MISFIKRNKRPLLLLFLPLFLFFSGAGILEQELELTGGLFFLSAFFVIVYGPISWVLARNNYLQLTETWWNKEVWTALLMLGLFSLIGVIDAGLLKPEFLLPFLLLLVFIGILVALHFRNHQIRKHGISTIDSFKISQLAFWCFAIGGGIMLLVFEEYDQQDPLVITSLFYFPLLFFLVIRWLFKQIRLILNLKNEQAKTELLHLKSQVNPHFFFNTLNNLYGLVEKDSKKARSLILKLSDMMRYSIYEGQKEQVLLMDEIAYLKNYVALHRMRYQKEIEVDFEMDIEEESIKIMPLLFIILLENAFKHGVENLIKDPFVQIKIKSTDREVYFEVSNNFDGKTKENATGIGLKNLKRRLELVYPNRHNLSFSIVNNVYKAQLSIQP